MTPCVCACFCVCLLARDTGQVAHLNETIMDLAGLQEDLEEMERKQEIAGNEAEEVLARLKRVEQSLGLNSSRPPPVPGGGPAGEEEEEEGGGDDNELSPPPHHDDEQLEDMSTILEAQGEEEETARDRGPGLDQDRGPLDQDRGPPPAGQGEAAGEGEAASEGEAAGQGEAATPPPRTPPLTADSDPAGAAAEPDTVGAAALSTAGAEPPAPPGDDGTAPGAQAPRA